MQTIHIPSFTPVQPTVKNTTDKLWLCCRPVYPESAFLSPQKKTNQLLLCCCCCLQKDKLSLQCRPNYPESAFLSFQKKTNQLLFCCSCLLVYSVVFAFVLFVCLLASCSIFEVVLCANKLTESKFTCSFTAMKTNAWKKCSVNQGSISKGAAERHAQAWIVPSPTESLKALCDLRKAGTHAWATLLWQNNQRQQNTQQNLSMSERIQRKCINATNCPK